MLVFAQKHCHQTFFLMISNPHDLTLKDLDPEMIIDIIVNETIVRQDVLEHDPNDRNGTAKTMSLFPVFFMLFIYSGWWYTYPSEKYESIRMVMSNIWKKMFQTTNQYWSFFKSSFHVVNFQCCWFPSSTSEVTTDLTFYILSQHSSRNLRKHQYFIVHSPVFRMSPVLCVLVFIFAISDPTFINY